MATAFGEAWVMGCWVLALAILEGVVQRGRILHNMLKTLGLMGGRWERVPLGRCHRREAAPPRSDPGHGVEVDRSLGRSGHTGRERFSPPILRVSRDEAEIEAEAGPRSPGRRRLAMGDVEVEQSHQPRYPVASSRYYPRREFVFTTSGGEEMAVLVVGKG
ncbi:hypothetical protein QBC39DRAFT_133830 [Podospora conica]|nr:hypothetical protein QBC39DRAFT_133830 [Schizothecium conicum]